ncbi:glucose-1-phosphate thymidylyltransferase [Halomicrobium salinisoli]|uniref:glucose-1-phosphate thymidylyltransferase n=1 Tax=Halomicrobium salinisoli TaxID=2878391 RepID=UPI001CF092DF|nr:glucose-1-phosphate thymidylyltransferase [Halomicrobium salinisoli]
MKSVVLAGGHGTRLKPLTHATQKQLLPVANNPVIEHIIENLREAGIDEIGIVLGGSYPEQIEEHVGDGSEYGVEVSYIHQGEPLGLAHAVSCAEDFVGDDDFIVYFGDTIVLGDIVDELVDAFSSETPGAAVCLQTVDDPSRFGIAELDDDDNITAVLEKPEDPPTDLAYIGVLAFSSDVFGVIERIEPSWRGELELTDVLDEIAHSDKPIHWKRYSDVWMDVGTPADLIETNRILLDRSRDSFTDEVPGDATVQGPVEVGDNCQVASDVVIEGPVSIGNDVTLESGAHIGPYASLGDGVTVEGSTIESSVLLAGSTVVGERTLSGSILGERTTIDEPENDGDERYVVGHESEIITD